MPDFKWFTKWNRDNPKDIFGPAYLVGAVGGAIVVAALVITWGYPAKTVSVQTGPRGTGMEVIKFASDAMAVDRDRGRLLYRVAGCADRRARPWRVTSTRTCRCSAI